MLIKDLRALVNSLPVELDEKNLVIREFGLLDENDAAGKYFKLDKPVGLMYYDETTNELALTDNEIVEKYKNYEWFPVEEGKNVADFDNTQEIAEDGEGGGSPLLTLASVPGMGPAVYASRGADGSGDVPSPSAVNWKKKKKRVKNYKDFDQK